MTFKQLSFVIGEKVENSFPITVNGEILTQYIFSRSSMGLSCAYDVSEKIVLGQIVCKNS